MATVTELVTKFSFTGNLSKLVDFNTGLGKGIKLVSGLGLAVKAASTAIIAFTASTLNSIEPISRMARDTGVGIERIQELGYVAEVSGSSVDAMNSTLTEFSKKVGEASFKGVEQFQQLGINVRNSNGQLKSTDELLLEVGQKLSGLSSAQQIDIGTKLGIDKSVIGVITQSSEQINQLTLRARELGVVSGEQARAVERTTGALKTLQFGMNAIRQQIAIAFAPQLEELSNWFVKLIANNKELITKGLSRIGEFIFQVSKAITRLLPVIGLIIAAFALWKIVTIGLSGVLGVVLSPVVLITAGILALLLIVDDLIVAFRGGNSVIRKFFLEFFNFDIKPVLEGIVQGALDIVDNFINAWTNIFSAFDSIIKAVVALFKGDFDGVFQHLQDAFSNLVNAFYNLFKPFINWITSKLENILPDWAKELIFGDSVPSEQVSASATQVNESFTKLISDAQRSANGSSETNVNQEVNNTSTINIYTDNPEQAGREAGRAMSSSLDKSLKTANDQIKRGGR